VSPFRPSHHLGTRPHGKHALHSSTYVTVEVTRHRGSRSLPYRRRKCNLLHGQQRFVLISNSHEGTMNGEFHDRIAKDDYGEFGNPWPHEADHCEEYEAHLPKVPEPNFALIDSSASTASTYSSPHRRGKDIRMRMDTDTLRRRWRMLGSEAITRWGSVDDWKRVNTPGCAHSHTPIQDSPSLLDIRCKRSKRVKPAPTSRVSWVPLSMFLCAPSSDYSPRSFMTTSLRPVSRYFNDHRLYGQPRMLDTISLTRSDCRPF